MRKSTVVAAFFILISIAIPAYGQMDVAFGASTVNSADLYALTFIFGPQPLNGGTYLSFTGNQIFDKDQVGVGGEISWKASQAIYAGYQPYRPIFWDFNGVWVPKIGRRAAGEFQAGIGAESIRFYNNFYTCNFVSCTNYTTSTHFMGHFSAGVRLYVTPNVFLRPEGHFYLVNNNQEFTSNKIIRHGVSLGYTFGGRGSPIRADSPWQHRNSRSQRPSTCSQHHDKLMSSHTEARPMRAAVEKLWPEDPVDRKFPAPRPGYPNLDQGARAQSAQAR